ncbi:MAG: hypothetical protein ABSF83_04140 [Nitrososphaerales archaeon]
MDSASTLWKGSASPEEEHVVSLADAFTAATALEFGARLVTGAEASIEGIDQLMVDGV